MNATLSTHSTPGLLAARLGCQPHHIVKLIKRNVIPYTRAGRWHLISEADVARVCEALRAAGYLREGGTGSA